MASKLNVPLCAACQKQYKYGGPTPHLLPCLHSVCETCLKVEHHDRVFCSQCHEYFIKMENEFSRLCSCCLFNKDANTSCSVCTEAELMLGKPLFPRDVITTEDILLLTANHFSSELLCTNRNDGNQAMSWCEKCEAFLCEHCQASHEDMKITRNHDVVPVKELANVDVDNRPQHLCSVHGGYPVEYFDQDCKEIICCKCSQHEHKNCKFIDLAEKIKTMKDETLRDNIRCLSQRVEDGFETTSALQALKTELVEVKERLDGVIKHTFEELRERLLQREAEISVQLNTCLDVQNKRITERLEQLEHDKQQSKSAMEYNSKCLKLLSPPQLLEVVGTVQARTAACLKEEMPKMRTEEASICFSRDGLKLLQNTIDGFGGFFTSLGEESTAEVTKEYVCITRTALAKFHENESALRQRISSLEEIIASQLTSDESRDEASFRCIVENISKLKAPAFSPPCMIRNLPWKIMAMKSKSTEEEKSLGFFLKCNTDTDSSSWSCSATAELKILPQRTGVEAFTRKFQHVFCQKENGWGYRPFISWTKLLNPDKGYVKDDKVILEVHVKADAPGDVG